MIKILENRKTMYEAIVSSLKANADKVASIPAMQEASTEFIG